MSSIDCANFLNDWLAPYIQTDETKNSKTATNRLLQSAFIEVSELPGKAGVYQIVASLKPQFQLPHPTIPLQLETKLYSFEAIAKYGLSW